MGSDTGTDIACRFRHVFTTGAKPGSTVACPQCRRESGKRVAVWVPVNSAAKTFTERYGHVRHKRAAGLKLHAGQQCEACGDDGAGLDHCHVHGWIRGILCTWCNLAMHAIDARQAGQHPPSLLDYWLNCPDCAAAGPWSPGEPPESTPHHGNRYSIYLSDELYAAWKASGLTLSEAVSRGLDVTERERAIVQRVLAAVPDEPPKASCKHPASSIREDGSCECGEEFPA